VCHLTKYPSSQPASYSRSPSPAGADNNLLHDGLSLFLVSGFPCSVSMSVWHQSRMSFSHSLIGFPLLDLPSIIPSTIFLISSAYLPFDKYAKTCLLLPFQYSLHLSFPPIFSFNIWYLLLPVISLFYSTNRNFVHRTFSHWLARALLWSAQFPHRGTPDLEHVTTSSQEQ